MGSDSLMGERSNWMIQMYLLWLKVELSFWCSVPLKRYSLFLYLFIVISWGFPYLILVTQLHSFFFFYLLCLLICLCNLQCARQSYRIYFLWSGTILDASTYLPIDIMLVWKLNHMLFQKPAWIFFLIGNNVILLKKKKKSPSTQEVCLKEEKLKQSTRF